MKDKEMLVSALFIIVGLCGIILFIMAREERYAIGAETEAHTISVMDNVSVVDKLATNIRIPADTLAYRLNNPFNLRYRGQYGAVRDDSNFAHFGSLREGIQAGINQIRLDADRGHTLKSFIFKYAPPEDGNDSIGYYNYVRHRLRLYNDPALSSVDDEALARAIMRMECGANWQQR